MKKILSKIGAGFLGAVMTGASLLVPVAIADSTANTLADYPAPFITDGATDMLMVIGADASPKDVLGAVNIAVELGSEPTETKEVETAGVTTTTMTGESALLASGSDHIYLEEGLEDGGVTMLTEDDLPTILADDSFEDDAGNKHGYEQTVEIGNSAFTFDDSNDLTNPALITDLGTDVSNPVYSFVVGFDKELDVTGSGNVQGEKITLFGKEYTIGTKSNTDEIQLLGGAMDIDLDWGETKTVTFQGESYEITLKGISDGNPDEATLTINGDTKTLEEEGTKKIGGIDIYADTVSYYGLESQPGIAVISLGADETWLEDGNEVEVGSARERIDYTDVTLTPNGSALTGVRIDVAAQDNNEDHLAIGESYTDPVFEAIKVAFTDVVNGPSLSTGKAGDANTDRRAVETQIEDADTLSVELTDKNGEEGIIPFAHDTDGGTADDMEVADKDGETVALVEGDVLDESGTETSRAGYTILNSDAEYVGMVEVDRLDDADNNNVDLELKDMITGATVVDWSDQDVSSEKDFTYKGKTFTVALADGADSGITIVDDKTDKKAVYPSTELYNGYDHRVAITDDVAIGETMVTTENDVAVGSKVYQLPTGTIQFRIADSAVGTAADDATSEYKVNGGDWTILEEADVSAGTSDIEELQMGNVVYSIALTETNDAASTLSVDEIAIDPDQDQTTDNDDEVTNAGLLIQEDEDATNSDAKEAIVITTNDGGVDGDATLDDPVLTAGTSVSATFDDKDYKGYLDAFGAYVLKDTSDSDQTAMTVTMPKTQMYADVYMSEVSSEVSTAGEGEVTYEKVVPIRDNIARMDTDEGIQSDKVNKNLILVGSPAVNRLTAAVLGVDYPTYGSQWTADENLSAKVPISGEGNAMIKMVNNAFGGGNVALVVAGWSADDSQAACTALQQFKKEEYGTYDLTKENVTVSGTTVKLVD